MTGRIGYGWGQWEQGGNGVKVFHGIFTAIGAAGVLFSLLAAWITMAPTSNELYERNLRISKAIDETRIKRLEAERDLRLEELETERMLEIERDVLRDAIVNDFKNRIGSRTRAQDETRTRNSEDRRRKLASAGLALLTSLLIFAYSVRRLRAEKRAEQS